MFSSKNAIADINDVPQTWVFEHYLKLEEKLTGKSLKMYSIFNPSDSNPSMYLYIPPGTGLYKFKCFSTGQFGNHIDLVMILYSIGYTDAVNKIMKDYSNYLNGHGSYETIDIEMVKVESTKKWSVTDYNIRPWSKYDVEFWSPYNIGSKLLNHYNVKPLGQYTMKRGVEEMVFNERSFTYAYTTKEGEIYKIYQPYKLEKKFMNFSNYLQGYDQLKNKKRLFICSSLKDIMSMRSLGIDGDYIAPLCENASIEQHLSLICKYDEKYIIFDNDRAGISRMEAYYDMYKIPFIHLKMSKDISDSVKIFGANEVKKALEIQIEHCKV